MDGCMINLAAEMHKVSDGSQTIEGVCEMISDGLKQCMKDGTNLFINCDKLVPDFTKELVWTEKGHPSGAIWDKPGWRTKNPGHNVVFNVVIMSCCEWGSGIEKILNRIPCI